MLGDIVWILVLRSAKLILKSLFLILGEKRPGSITLASLHGNLSFWLGGRWDLWRETVSYSLPQPPHLSAVLQTQPTSVTHDASLFSEGTLDGTEFEFGFKVALAHGTS